MLRKSIKFIFVLMAMTLFLTPAWGSTRDATDVEDQTLTFVRNHGVAGTRVWVEFLGNQSVLARGGGSGGGSGGGYGGGSHGKGSPGTNAAQQHQHQYQRQQNTKKQNQHQQQQREGSGTQNQHQYQQQQKTEKQNQHQYQYQHREESGAQN